MDFKAWGRRFQVDTLYPSASRGMFSAICLLSNPFQVLLMQSGGNSPLGLTLSADIEKTVPLLSQPCPSFPTPPSCSSAEHQLREARCRMPLVVSVFWRPFWKKSGFQQVSFQKQLPAELMLPINPSASSRQVLPFICLCLTE